MIEPGSKWGAGLKGLVSAVLEKFVFAGSDDHQIRLIAKDFLEDGKQAIAGIRDAATIDGLISPSGISAGQFHFEPSWKCRVAQVGVAIDGRTAEAKDAEGARGFLGGKFLGAEERLACASGAINSALPLEERSGRIEAGSIIRLANIEEAQGYFEENEGGESKQYGADSKEHGFGGAVSHSEIEFRFFTTMLWAESKS